MEQELLSQLKSLSKLNNQLIKLLQVYNRLKQEPLKNAYPLDKKLTEINKIKDKIEDPGLKGSLNRFINTEKENLEKIKEEFRFRFGQELKTLLEKDGVALRGQYPIMRIGLFTLKLDFEFGSATLFFGPEIEKIRARIPLQTTTIYETIKKVDEELRKSCTNLGELYQKLYEAYKRTILLKKRPFGDRALLTEVLTQFVFLNQPKKFFIEPKRENYNEFSRMKLGYLIYQLKRGGYTRQGMRLYVATFDATLNKLQFLWVPENEQGEGTHYAYISFEK